MNWHKIFPKIYVRVRPDKLSVLLIGTGLSEEVEPKVAITLKNNKPVAVGDEADMADTIVPGACKIVNGFDHPRIVMRDFDAAVTALRYLLVKLLSRMSVVSPIMVINPPEMEGGLSQIECRALKDLCIAAGAREVYITEHDLKESELMDIKALKKRLSNQ